MEGRSLVEVRTSPFAFFFFVTRMHIQETNVCQSSTQPTHCSSHRSGFAKGLPVSASVMAQCSFVLLFPPWSDETRVDEGFNVKP